MKSKKITLKNGVDVYLYNDKSKHSIYFSLVVKYGGVHSHFKIGDKKYHLSNGIAHFLEHYLLEHSKYGDVMELLGKKQMARNGVTSMYKTHYFFEAVEEADYGIDLLIKAMNDPQFDAKLIEKVKEPIYREINRSQDDKLRIIFESSIKNSFQSYTYVNTLGTTEDIQNLDYETINLCYNVFYQLQNQFLVVAGNFNEKHIIEIIEKAYAQIKKSPLSFELIKLKEPEEVKKKETTLSMPVNNPLVSISYKINIKEYQKYELMKLYDYIYYFIRFNFGIISPLYKKLTTQKIINDLIKTQVIKYEDYMLINIINYTNNPQEYISNVKNLIKNRDFHLTSETFKLFKKDIKMAVSFRPENLIQVINPFINNIIDYNYEEYDSIEEVEKDNIDDYLKVIDNTNFDHCSTVIIKDIDVK